MPAMLLKLVSPAEDTQFTPQEAVLQRSIKLDATLFH